MAEARCPVLPERGVQSRSNQQHVTQRLALGLNHDLGLKLGLLDLVSHLQGHVDHCSVARAPAWNVKHRVDLPLSTHTWIPGGNLKRETPCWSTSVHTPDYRVATWNTVLIYLCQHTPEYRVAIWNVKRRVDLPLSTHTWIPGGNVKHRVDLPLSTHTSIPGGNVKHRVDLPLSTHTHLNTRRQTARSSCS